MDGNITKSASYDHITSESLENILPSFVGKIQQIPPIFSALKVNGKALYKHAREGKSANDIEIKPREVEILKLELIKYEEPDFEIYVECGGGTYIRSLVRDIGYKLDCVATTTVLERTKQGQFVVSDSLEKKTWSADTIYAAIEKFNLLRQG